MCVTIKKNFTCLFFITKKDGCNKNVKMKIIGKNKALIPHETSRWKKNLYYFLL